MSAHCGERHPLVRLSDETVREMRAVYERWRQAGVAKGYKTLGEIFGCSQWTARDIVTYRTRKSA